MAVAFRVCAIYVDVIPNANRTKCSLNTQVKLSYSLHPETRMPVGYSVYEHNDSHRLIEEFMLLANMAVAHRLNEVYPEKALLRRYWDGK